MHIFNNNQPAVNLDSETMSSIRLKKTQGAVNGL